MAGGTNAITVSSGLNGTTGTVRGDGGDVSVQVAGNMLATGAGNVFNVTKHDGLVTVAVNTLTVGNTTTTGAFTYNQTNALTASDSVVINSLGLVNGGTFTVGGGAAFGGVNQACFNNLAVTGSGNLALGAGNTYTLSATNTLAFNIAANVAQGASILNVTSGNINLNNLTANNLQVSLGGQLSGLQIGQSFNLINGGAIASSGIFLDTVQKNNVLGGLTLYNFDLNLAGGAITATLVSNNNGGGNPGDGDGGDDGNEEGVVIGKGSNPYLPYSEATAAGLLNVTDATRSMEDNLDLISAGKPGEVQLSVILEGEKIRNKTGSHVDLKGLSANLAAGYKLRVAEYSDLTLGAFFETGRGNYDTYNTLPVLNDVHGNGDSNYYGGGLFATNDFRQGSHAEASVRAGSLTNKYDIAQLNSGASFDTSNAYLGAHLGIGHAFDITENNMIDAYGKVFWTHVNSDDFTTDFGEKVQTDAADSLRSRLGARFTHIVSRASLRVFAGAGWEHEFMGDTKITVNNVKYDESADLRGSSAFGEIGMMGRASDCVTLSAKAFGLVGQQRGIGGTFGVNVIF